MLQPAPEDQAHFTSYEALKDYVEDAKEETSVHRINFTSGDTFYMHDDNVLVHKPINSHSFNNYQYTESAIKKLFTILGCGSLYASMSLGSSFGMATAYINNILSPKNPYAKELNGYNFIETGGKIIGFFSQKYSYVDNTDVLKHAAGLMRLHPNKYGSPFQFSEASVVNTKMKLRCKQDYTGFKLRNNKDDICTPGVELRNSHLGDTALSTKIYTYRLICANGAIANSNKMNSRLIHRGNAEHRIGEVLTDLEKGYNDVKNRIEKLLKIPYKFINDGVVPSTSQMMLEMNAPIRVLPEMNESSWYSPNKKFKDDYTKSHQLKASAYNLDQSHVRYPGVCSNIFGSVYRKGERSLYDWTEIFTERANHESYSIKEKEEIQENVGTLVEYLAKKSTLLN